MSTASFVIVSPQTTTGTAGGQETVSSAHIRPTEFSTFTIMLSENTASRTDISCSGLHILKHSFFIHEYNLS